MNNIKIRYLDIDDTYYIENDVVKVKVHNNSSDTSDICSIDDIGVDVKNIIMKAKEYDETILMNLQEAFCPHSGIG